MMKKGLICVITVLLLALVFTVSCKEAIVYYNVKFNSNGGTVYKVQQVAEGDCVLKVQDPVKDGCTFLGWYSDPKFEFLYDFNKPVHKDMTLYAKWSSVFVLNGDKPFSVEFGSAVLALKNNSAATWKYVEYSVDGGGNWTEWKGESVTSGSENKLYFRGSGNTVVSGGIPWTIQAVGSSVAPKITCSGNIMALLDYKNPDAALMGSKCFCNMFRGCTGLAVAPTLPAETMEVSCYEGMFYDCKSLKTAPALPAKILAEACYKDMFNECEALVDAPELPAKTLEKRCYMNMFAGCVSLVEAPILPAENLVGKKDGDADTGCYSGMFRGCTNLKLITVGFGSWYENESAKTNNKIATYDWVYGVNEEGTFVALDSSLDMKKGASNVPENYVPVGGNNYTVNFVTNGATTPSSGYDSQSVPYGGLVAKPSPDPTKSDFHFGGWFSDSDLTDEWDFSTDIVEGDMTLYAKWMCRVTYDANGATIGTVPVDSNEYSVGDLVYVEGKGDLKNPGYVFEGWSETVDGTVVYDFYISKNTTLYAKWEAGAAYIVETSKTYNSLKTAVTEAKSGQTIKVMKGMTISGLNETYTFADNVTFDLNGQTITINETILNCLGNNLTIKNGTFSYGLIVGSSDTSYSGVILENLTIGSNFRVYANNVTFRGTTVNGGSFDGIDFGCSIHDVTINIESGKYSSSYSAVVYYCCLVGTGTVCISGGEFTANGGAALFGKTSGAGYNPTLNVSITGGKFNKDPTSYLAKEYATEEVSANSYKVTTLASATDGSVVGGNFYVADSAAFNGLCSNYNVKLKTGYSFSSPNEYPGYAFVTDTI